MSLEHLRKWVEDVSGLPTIWMHQNAPRPERDFIGIQSMHRKRIGEEEYSYVDENGIQKTVGNREYYISIQAFTTNDFNNPRQAVDILAYLQDRLNVMDDYMWLYERNIGVIRQHKIQPLPRIISEGYQLKATWDIVVLVKSIIETQAPYIEDVESSLVVPFDQGKQRVEITHPKSKWYVTDSSIEITGVSEPNATITLGADFGESTTADSNGEWSIPINLNVAGVYRVTATDGNTVDVTNFEYRESLLIVTNLSEGDIINDDKYTIEGKATPSTFIHANGNRIYVETNGTWKYSQTWVEGNNKLEVYDGVEAIEVNFGLQT